MKNAESAVWATSPSTLRRSPTNLELAGGFPCGPLDLPLFNELMNRLGQAHREIVYTITQSGQTPNTANLTQLYEAIQALIRQFVDQLQITGGRVSVFSTPGAFTWPVPEDARLARVVVLGGGGGGGGASSGAGGGGGGGGYDERTFSVAGLTSCSGIVGSGGLAGLANGQPATSGGTSSFTANGVSVSATGGAPGGFGNGGSVGLGGGPGQGTGGDYQQFGGTGQNGFIIGTTGQTYNFGGIGASSRIASSTPFPAGNGQFAGSGPGGAGSGAAGTDPGGAGKPGLVIAMA